MHVNTADDIDVMAADCANSCLAYLVFACDVSENYCEISTKTYASSFGTQTAFQREELIQIVSHQ